MITTLALAGWIVALIYTIRAGGPAGILRALRDPNTPRAYKVALAICALPIPGPIDELVAAYVLRRLAKRGQAS